jgi:DNA-binding transcriptional ArsR family regulator
MREELTLDDPRAVKALFDPLRFRLFGLLREPRSVRELAHEVDLPADRLYYHLHRLVERGLVHEVEIRTTGRHLERVYERTAERITFTGDVDLAGESPLRGIVQEVERALVSAAEDDPASVSYHVLSLVPERARELEERLRGLFAEFDDRAPQAAGARPFAALGVLAPLAEEPEPE